MPELPEIEIVKRSLLKKINKTTITNIGIKNKKLRYKLPCNFSKKLKNLKILNISRRSKYLIFYFRNKILLAHLGMTGKFFILRKKDRKIYKTSFYYNLNIKEKHSHFFFILNNGLILIYNDVRKFGFFKLYNTLDLNKIKFLTKLGPEPLSNSFNEKYFEKKISNKIKNIKNLLMDQSFISGLGNIYVNEVLFLSRVNPLRRCSKLKITDIKNIILNIKKVLKISIYRGGSSIKDFEDAQGQKGSYQQLFNVYGLENAKCSRLRCNGKIKKIFISNRSSFYCSRCQK